MMIREYINYNEDEIISLYSAVGWQAYTADRTALRKGFENSLCVLADYEDGELAGAPGVLAGKAIREHLEGCSRAVLLAATLSSSIDTLLRQMSVTGMAEAMAVDALASAAVEQVLDIAEESIFRELANTSNTSAQKGGSLYAPSNASAQQGGSSIAPPERSAAPDILRKDGFYAKPAPTIPGHTFRFSPGYADFPLEVQPKLLEILDAPRRIGLTVSPSLLLIPTKSVTCILGVGEHLPKELPSAKTAAFVGRTPSAMAPKHRGCRARPSNREICHTSSVDADHTQRSKN